MIDFVLNVCSLQPFIFSLCSFLVCAWNSEYLFTTGYLKEKGEEKARTKLESFWIVGSCSSQSSSESEIILLFLELEREKKNSV